MKASNAVIQNQAIQVGAMVVAKNRLLKVAELVKKLKSMSVSYEHAKAMTDAGWRRAAAAAGFERYIPSAETRALVLMLLERGMDGFEVPPPVHDELLVLPKETEIYPHVLAANWEKERLKLDPKAVVKFGRRVHWNGVYLTIKDQGIRHTRHCFHVALDKGEWPQDWVLLALCDSSFTQATGQPRSVGLGGYISKPTPDGKFRYVDVYTD